MTIGQTIKKIRRERNITQEGLAEYLGITSQAVSGWECDRSAPDISQLPLLANIFGVTTDELLGVHVEKREERIREICERAQKLFADGCWDDSTYLLRKGLLEYPNAYPIMTSLAGNLFCQSFRCDVPDYSRRNMREDALEYTQKVIAECTDINTKTLAIQYACDLYDCMGKKEKAIELAMTVPEISRQILLRNLYEGSRLTEFYRENILNDISVCLYEMGQLAECTDDEKNSVYTEEEQLAIERKITAIYEILFEDGDYNFFAQFPRYAYLRMAEIYSGRNDAENTLMALRNYVRFGIQFCEYPEDAVQTSMLFRGVTFGGWVKGTPDGVEEIRNSLRSELEEKRYDFVRDTPEFAEIHAMLTDA